MAPLVGFQFSVTWPMPGIGTRPVTGPGVVGTVIVTLSKVAVLSLVLSWLVTARPTVKGEVIAMVVAAPMGVQVFPSGEKKPLRVLPVLTTRTQTGMTPLPPEAEV